jgi:hypothetical protein
MTMIKIGFYVAVYSLLIGLLLLRIWYGMGPWVNLGALLAVAIVHLGLAVKSHRR